MKLSIITASALAAGSLASDTQLNAREIEDLIARGIDPKTMDPTRLSVLSVLRTAIPSGSAFPRPTGDFQPEWYSKLPEDVKSLLPELYPAPVAAASANVSVSATTTGNVSQSPTPTLAPAVSPTLTAPTPSL